MGPEAQFKIVLVDETGSQPGAAGDGAKSVSPIQSGSPEAVFARMLADVAGGGKALPVVISGVAAGGGQSFAPLGVAQALSRETTAHLAGNAAAAAARSQMSVDKQEQAELGIDSLRMLAMGQIIGSTGLPGANIARFFLAQRAMQNEMKREALKLSQSTPGSRDFLNAEQGFAGAQMQEMMTGAFGAMAVIGAVDQAIGRIGDAISSFYKAETNVMTGQLRAQGSAIAFDVTGHARAQIGMQRSEIEASRMTREAAVGWIPIVGGIARLIHETQSLQPRERELAEREQTMANVGAAEQRFRQLAAFNPALAAQSAMQDVGRLFRTMDQSRRLGDVYGAFSERYFRHEAEMEEIFARTAPRFLETTMRTMERNSVRQQAEALVDAEINEIRSQATRAFGADFARGLSVGGREDAVRAMVEHLEAIRDSVREMAERDPRGAGMRSIFEARPSGEGAGYEASREAPTAAMRRASMEVPPPVIDIP